MVEAIGFGAAGEVVVVGTTDADCCGCSGIDDGNDNDSGAGWGVRARIFEGKTAEVAAARRCLLPRLSLRDGFSPGAIPEPEPSAAAVATAAPLVVPSAAAGANSGLRLLRLRRS